MVLSEFGDDIPVVVELRVLREHLSWIRNKIVF